MSWSQTLVEVLRMKTNEWYLPKTVTEALCLLDMTELC